MSRSRAAERTKGQITDAAVSLFSIRGFGSTSIREIAESANVNSALISYHFKNKQGILESMMINYYEALFELLQNQTPMGDCYSQLIQGARVIIEFQCNNAAVTTIILRELSVDSMLVREVMSTYVIKLKAHFSALLEKAVDSGEFRSDFDLDMQLIHILGCILFPYFNTQLIREVFYEEPTSDDFRLRYMNYLSKIWFYQLKK